MKILEDNILASDVLKIKILKCLYRENIKLSLNKLTKKNGSLNFKSVRRNCEFLKICGFIDFEKIMDNNICFLYISITDKGKEFMKILNERRLFQK